jgi:prolyl-tRNA synthetase
MRRTSFFCETLRQVPGESDVAGHQLLVRGGYIQELASGIYSLLPLGHRVAAKIEQIMREEMDRTGGQEVTMPVVQPAELWQETERWQAIGPELARFKDRNSRDMVLAMTHEEVIADLLRKQINSYRQLPVMLYQIQTKFRDEPRARGGLIRAREFTMKDAYSAHTSFEDLDRYYDRMYDAYFKIFERVGLPVIAVQSDVGMMGGTMAHEYMFLSEIGEDQLVLCNNCGYSANRQAAIFRNDTPRFEEERPLEEVYTPGTTTISALAELLRVPASKTAKAAFFMAGDRFIFAVVRGDMEVNETKLANAVGAPELRPARPDEIEAVGAVPGFASPINVHGATVVVDDLVVSSPNLVAGANKEDHHLLNTNTPRDYRPDVVTDIAAAYEGAPCVQCGNPVHLVRGVEVGNIFKLGTKYSKPLGAQFRDEQGQLQDIVMGSYGIGVGRLMACIAERCRDERGLTWPVAVAPFHVYLVGLDLERDEVRAAAESLYNGLRVCGQEVLYDDRDVRAGVKFNDADLLGMPLRVTVSARTLAADSVELKTRVGTDTQLVRINEAATSIAAELSRLQGDVSE